MDVMLAHQQVTLTCLATQLLTIMMRLDVKQAQRQVTLICLATLIHLLETGNELTGWTL